jgi:hypothetical protein
MLSCVIVVNSFLVIFHSMDICNLFIHIFVDGHIGYL